MSRSLASSEKCALCFRVLAWVCAVIVICTAAPGLNGAPYQSELSPVYSAIAFGGLTIIFMTVWILATTCSKHHHFHPDLAIFMDISFLLSLTIIGVCLAANNFIRFCDYYRDKIDAALASLPTGSVGASAESQISDKLDSAHIPKCDLLRVATVYTFLTALCFLGSLWCAIYSYKHHNIRKAAGLPKQGVAEDVRRTPEDQEVAAPYVAVSHPSDGV